MINREVWHTIKQLHDRSCYQKDIAETLGNQYWHGFRGAETPTATGQAASRGTHPSKLDTFNPLIEELFVVEAWNAEVIYAEINTWSYRVDRTLVRLYIATKRRLRASKVTVHFETDPGR